MLLAMPKVGLLCLQLILENTPLLRDTLAGPGLKISPYSKLDLKKLSRSEFKYFPMQERFRSKLGTRKEGRGFGTPSSVERFAGN
ncbi:MAG: hypothetical protein DWQ01_11180 [Planctomycetota bacterium]|nr:MAG: hypothetical protein DWQ01_11180 [Planctomycetota bacterium]